MSASIAKYANLPDIDTEQSDVYETPDVVVDGGSQRYEQPEIPLSEDISVDPLRVDKAAARFRASAGGTDVKSALSRYQRSLFRTLQLESLSGGSSLEVTTGTASHLSETREQRMRRLIYETQELRDQIAQDKAKNTEDRQSVALMKLATGLTDELAQLSLQVDRQSLDAEGSSNSLVSSSLWQRLESSASPSVQQSERRPAAPRPTADGAAATTLQLESRVSLLEKVLGTSSAQPARDAAVGHSLVDVVSRLRQQLDVLADPQRIDGIQRRIKQVLVDMDRLDLVNMQATRAAESADAKAAGTAPRVDPATVKRIDELYEKLTGVDALIELAPTTARRLQTLSALHVEASQA
ncbi:hypothetical protein GGI04_002699, partial [Coemansia thaxteri]